MCYYKAAKKIEKLDCWVNIGNTTLLPYFISSTWLYSGNWLEENTFPVRFFHSRAVDDLEMSLSGLVSVLGSMFWVIEDWQ